MVGESGSGKSTLARAVLRLVPLAAGQVLLRGEDLAILTETELRARRRDDQGRWRTISLNGQPRFDANGAFVGYWGVARDVTHEVRAERAVAASETRYRELFTRSPSPTSARSTERSSACSPR